VLGPKGAECASGGGGCQVGSSDASCAAGSRVVGGGFSASTPDNAVVYAAVTSNTTYSVISVNYSSVAATLQAQAICVSGPGVPAVSVNGSSMSSVDALQLYRAQLSADH
jgi:hypothetical protein